MPTTLKITKDMILQTAFEIAKEKGPEGISNREIAKRMNCSIRPIYYQFNNVEELSKELYLKIEDYFYKFLMIHSNNNIPLYKQIGMNYIKFAQTEKNLFKILFMNESKYFPKEFAYDRVDGFKKLSQIIKENTNLSDDNIHSFHNKMWFFTHGVATLVASNTIEIDEEQIQQLLTAEFQALMSLIKK